MSAWPPPLPDHLRIVERWRPMNPSDLAELRAALELGPVEAIECVVRDTERGTRELLTAFRRIEDAAEAPPLRLVAAEKPERAADVSQAIDRAREAQRARVLREALRGRRPR